LVTELEMTDLSIFLRKMTFILQGLKGAHTNKKNGGEIFPLWDVSHSRQSQTLESGPTTTSTTLAGTERSQGSPFNQSREGGCT
jgi:hypothetical protein